MAGYRSPYETLGVSPDAEPIVIEAAYKALIKKYHPDLWLRDPNAQDRAATINEAFAILRNPETRSLCDQQLRAMRNAAQAAALRPVRPRKRGARWWSGWLVALIVAAVQFIPWDEIVMPAAQLAARSAPARVAAVAEAEAKAEVEEPPVKVQKQVQNLGGQEKPLPDGLVELLTKAREQQTAFLASLDEPQPPARQNAIKPTPRQNARKRDEQHPPAPAQSPPEGDFLEREGFIY